MNIDQIVFKDDIDVLDEMRNCIDNFAKMEPSEESIIDFIQDIFNKHKSAIFGFRKNVGEEYKRYSIKKPIKDITAARKYIAKHIGKDDAAIMDIKIEYPTGLVGSIHDAETAIMNLVKFCINNKVFKTNLDLLTEVVYNLSNNKPHTVKTWEMTVSAHEKTTSMMLGKVRELFVDGQRRRVTTRPFSELYSSLKEFITVCDMCLDMEKHYMGYVDGITKKAKVSEQLVDEMIEHLKETTLVKKDVLEIANTVYKLDQIYLAFGDSILHHMAIAHSFTYALTYVKQQLNLTK